MLHFISQERVFVRNMRQIFEFSCCNSTVFPDARLQHKVEQSVHVLMPLIEETVNLFSSFAVSRTWNC